MNRTGRRKAARAERRGESPTERRVRQVEGLLEVMPRRASALFDEYLRARDMDATAGHEYLLAVVAGWCMFIRESIPAVLLLQERGLGVQAAPIRRNILEHAIACFTVAREPGSYDGALRKQKSDAAKYLAAAQAAGAPHDIDGIRAVLEWEIDDSTKPLDRLVQVKLRFDGLDVGGPRLYVQWLEETVLSHANPATASMYLRQDPARGEFPTLVSEPILAYSDWWVAASCTDALLLGLASLSLITEGDPLAEAIDDLNEERNSLLRELESLRGS